MEGNEADFSINSWRSHRLKRVVKATLGSEALAMDDALAEIEWIRALWHEIMDPSSCVMDRTRLGPEASVLVGSAEKICDGVFDFMTEVKQAQIDLQLFEGSVESVGEEGPDSTRGRRPWIKD
eukprot:g3399.t1